MNPNESRWGSCKRSITPDVSLVKDQENTDYYYRAGFPLSSTPPNNARTENIPKASSPDSKYLLRSELSAIKSELEKIQRMHEKSKEYEILQLVNQQLTDLRAELAQVKKFNETKQNCACKQKKSKEYEILQSISQQLTDLKSELIKPNNAQVEENRPEMIDKEIQVCYSVSENSTQTSQQPVHRVRPDYPVKTTPSILDNRQTPIATKKYNLPQSDLSMTANKILKKYLPDEPAPPTPLWRQTEYENLIFNMTNVSVAMHRPPRNDQMWQNTTKPRYDENWPYSPNGDYYRQPVEPPRRIPIDEYDEPERQRIYPPIPRYEEDWPYNPRDHYRQSLEPVRRMDEYDEPEPDWRENLPKQKLIGLSAIMNQPKLL